jgi:16S rRNA (guanine966-N2)-methyltransferase
MSRGEPTQSPRKAARNPVRANSQPNRLRIVGGRWRGMRIDFPPVEAIRPTPDRVRETLFNWLQQRIVGSACLDLFAGSGALGIEALSRGAGHVTFVERDARVTRHLSATLERLRTQDGAIVTSDALAYLEAPRGEARGFDIVFLDPPFAAPVLPDVFSLLGRHLAPEAYVYVECSARAALPALPAGWSVYRSKRAGEVGYHLLRTVAAPAAEEL